MKLAQNIKIVFIQPAWTEHVGSYRRLAKEFTPYPPLGLLYLAQIAIDRGYHIEIIDNEVQQIPHEQLAQRLAAEAPSLIGITACTPQCYKAIDMAKEIKKRCDTEVIVGGPHSTHLKEKFFHESFDYMIYGEGEKTFEEFLQARQSGSYDKVNGLIYREKGRVIVEKPRSFIMDLDDIKFPWRDSIRWESYKILTDVRGKISVATIITTRGCPFQCVFCADPAQWGKTVRTRSATNVVDEIVQVKKRYGIDHFLFVDSTLTLDPNHIYAMCDEMLKRGVHITWEGWTRANLVTRDLLKKMKEAGFIRMAYGIESGSERILKLLKKNVTLDQMREAFRITKELGIEATCTAMMGNPGETEENVWETVRFINSIKEINYAPLSMAIPYPGTELYNIAKKGEHGLRLVDEDFSKFARYAGGVMEVNGMSPRELRRLQIKALIRMHIRPQRIIGGIRRFGLLVILRTAGALLTELMRRFERNRATSSYRLPT